MIQTILFALGLVAMPTMDDRLINLQNEWVQICAESEFSEPMEAHCKSTAHSSISKLRSKFVGLRHPHLETTVDYAMGRCLEAFTAYSKGRRSLTTPAKAIESMDQLATCTIKLYDHLLEKAGGEQGIIDLLSKDEGRWI